MQTENFASWRWACSKPQAVLVFREGESGSKTPVRGPPGALRPFPGRREGFGGLLFDKLLAAIALRVKQRREIAVINACGGSFRYQRLGPEGNAQPGIADHQ